MNSFITDTIIRFSRIVISAGLVALADGLLNVDLTLGLKGAAGALGVVVITAVIHAATEFARTFFGSQVPVTSKSKAKLAGALRARAKTVWDYLPI